jgi:hypothetical protein
VVREIHNVTHEYEVVRPQVTSVTQEYKTYNSFSEFHSTDNSIHASDGSTVIKDSFNQDNDGVDNKGGVINESTVGGGNVSNSGNEVQQTHVEDSLNETHQTDVEDSFNVGVPDGGGSGPDDGGDDGDGGTHVSIAYGEPYGGGDSYGAGTVNDSYDVHGPAASTASADMDEPVGAEHS